MTVRELQGALDDFNPEADVCIEIYHEIFDAQGELLDEEWTHCTVCNAYTSKDKDKVYFDYDEE